jgi:hypothetical protein
LFSVICKDYNAGRSKQKNEPPEGAVWKVWENPNVVEELYVEEGTFELR